MKSEIYFKHTLEVGYILKKIIIKASFSLTFTLYLGKHYKKSTQDAFLSGCLNVGIFLLDKVNLIQSYYFF